MLAHQLFYQNITDTSNHTQFETEFLAHLSIITDGLGYRETAHI